MTQQSTSPNVAVDLMRMHKVITRGLDVSVERSRAYASGELGATESAAGFLSYVRTLISLIHGHSLTEDDVAFPYFREKLSNAPFDLLSSEHREIQAVLDEATIILDVAPENTGAFGRLHDLLQTLKGMWRPHIQREEVSLSPEQVARLVDVPEQIRLSRLFAEHNQKQSGPDCLAVPFMLYNLAGEDRAALAQTLSPFVTELLVPVVWKEKWAPMAPFLLR